MYLGVGAFYMQWEQHIGEWSQHTVYCGRHTEEKELLGIQWGPRLSILADSELFALMGS